MKLSDDTLGILKNFSTINQGIFFRQGTKLATISPNKNIFAEAGIGEVIPTDFGIYDLNNFLQILTLEKDCPDLDFIDKNVIIKTLAGRSKIKYRFAGEDMIVTPPQNKKLSLSSVDVEFTLTDTDYAWIMKTSTLLNSEHITIQNDGSGIKMTACDEKDNSKSTNSISVGEDDGKKYKLAFSRDNLKMIPGSYEVKICAKNFAHFSHTTKDIQYWIALEPKYTKYEG